VTDEHSAHLAAPVEAGPDPDDDVAVDATGAPTDETTTDDATADADLAPVQVAPPTHKEPSRTRNMIEWIIVVVGALGVALLVNAFLFQPFRIPSLSMYPTLHKGDRVVVNKMSYHAHPIHRGDVVVFTKPDCKAANQPVWSSCGGLEHIDDLIKRVVAVGGDRIDIHDGKLFINGTEQHEPYLAPGTVTAQATGCAFPMSYTVPKGDVFVMGDNRGDSQDGRCFGPIPNSSVVGRAFVRIWPLGRIGLL
jgi:signal peptidase I